MRHSTDYWQLQIETITSLQVQQNHVEAVELCTQLLKKLPTTSAKLVIQVRLQSHLIDSLKAQALYSQAQVQIKCAQATLSDVKAVYPTKISLPLELKILSQQGTLAQIQGQYASSEQVFQQAIQLAEAYGLCHQPVWLTLLNGLAIVYKYWGRFEAAETLYKTALADSIKQHGEHDIGVATLYHNLAGLNHACGDYVEAESYARKSYRLHVELLGSQHAQTIADRAALGAILHGLQQWDEAIDCFEAAIAFFERQFGQVHGEIAINLNNLAASLQAKGELKQAEQAYRRALAIKEQLLGKSHPNVAISLNNLASLLQQTGQLAEAKTLFIRALAIFDITVGLDHPHTQLCRENAAQYSSL
ncbi:MAG: tetratricopeptide repeat protein [Cyanobacteria bacterium J06635_15]